MALLWDASLTDAGVSMISQWAQGTGNKLTITGAVIGEGVVAATQLHALTQLTDQKSTISIQGFESVANGVKLKLRKTSQGITTSFILNQIGIYAKLDTSGGTPIIADSLIAVYQQDTGILVPTEADSPDFVFTFYGTVQTNYQGDLTINVDTSAILSQDDIADNLVTADATMALSANMGVKIADNLAANENVYGAKNLFIYPYSSIPTGGNGMTFTDVGNGPITISGIASADTFIYLEDPAKIYLKNGQYKLSGTPHFGDTVKLRLYLAYKDTNNNTVVINVDNNTATGENTFTINGSYGDVNGAACNAYIKIFNGADCSSPVTFYPMIRDARILDPTYAPPAKTNLQLTNDKAERDDLSTIHATGSTNTTGAQINAGTFFYLNGQFCKALTNIAANATFTEDTNYKKDTVGKNVTALNGLINGSVKQYANTNTLLSDVGLPIESRTTQQFVNAIPKGIYMCPIVNTASDPTDIPSSYGVFVIFKSGTTGDQIGAIFIAVNSKLYSFSSYSGAWTSWT